jgi:predicted amidohydrolase
MLVEGGKLEANLARAEDCIRRAHRAGAAAIVLPECLDTGWLHGSLVRLAQPVPGPTSAALCRMARDHAIIVAAGITERQDGRFHNTALLIDEQGRILRQHRKINELGFAQKTYAVGSSLEVVDTSIGRVGLAICADLSPGAGAIGPALALMRAQIILSPTAWAVPPDHDNAKDPYGGMWRESYVAIAARFGIPTVAVSNVGPVEDGEWKGWTCIGCSMAIGRGGERLADLPYGIAAEELRIVEVEVPPPRVAHNW